MNCFYLQVQQRDVPGIDCAFLAMDTEEGVEVVWNEVRISEKKSSKVQLVCNSGFFLVVICLPVIHGCSMLFIVAVFVRCRCCVLSFLSISQCVL